MAKIKRTKRPKRKAGVRRFYTVFAPLFSAITPPKRKAGKGKKSGLLKGLTSLKVALKCRLIGLLKL